MSLPLADDLQRVGMAHLEACYAALAHDRNGAGHPVESPASAPFCGCEVCVVRELAWAMATELMERGLAE